MKPCQLCGACSWGKIGPDLTAFKSVANYLSSCDTTLFVSCDNCGAVAAKVFLEQSEAPAVAPTAFDPIQTILQGFQHAQAASPKPLTRTERLLGDLLMSGPRLSAAQCVQFVRAAEAELDQPSNPDTDPTWLRLKFADRVACQTWLYSLIEPGLERYYLTDDRLREALFTVDLPSRIAAALTTACLTILDTQVTLEAPQS